MLNDPEDVQGLSQSLHESLSLRKQAMEASSSRALEQASKFDWRKCATGTLEVYRDLS
jgi:glycosyltransferase involved in cell wall biosynthesis